ncbi:hypothetical protein HJFPF1_13567 [Paramyrothecium foliicola]|nr:hypothetical protein HJFPF1_13567 [Paramyrothecium foliicola]
MTIQIQLVTPSEVPTITLAVDFPATKDGPWYRLHFPPTYTQTESEIQGIIEIFSSAIRQAMTESQRIFKIFDDKTGEAKGICGWTKSMTPMDTSWSATGARLVKEEVNRVWKSHPELACVTFMSVHPAHQRKGYGTLLLTNVCKEIDQHGLACFVMSSPAAKSFYQGFSFRTIRNIETEEGSFTSMVRLSKFEREGIRECDGWSSISA